MESKSHRKLVRVDGTRYYLHPWKVNERIYHKEYGNGTIYEIDSTEPSGLILKVRFEDGSGQQFDKFGRNFVGIHHSRLQVFDVREVLKDEYSWDYATRVKKKRGVLNVKERA